MRLRYKLLIVPSIVMLLFAAFALIAVELFSQWKLQTCAESHMMKISVLLANQGEKHLHNELCELESWAGIPFVINTAIEQHNSDLVNNFADYFKNHKKCNLHEGVLLLGLNGECIAAYDHSFINSPHAGDIARKSPDALAAYNGSTSIGETQISVVSSRPVVPLSVPVYHKNHVVAILRTNFDMGHLSEHLIDAACFNGSINVFIDLPCLDTTVAMPDGQTLQGNLLADSVKLALKERSTGINYVKNNNKDFIIASTKMSRLPWVITVVQPVCDVLAPVKQVRNISILVFILLAIFLIGAITCFIAPAVGGIEGCHRLADKIRDGKFDQRLPISGSDEVAGLENALNAMASSLDQSRKDLEAAERKYRDLFENAIEGIFQTTQNGTIVIANKSLARIIDMASAEACIGTSNLGRYADPTLRDKMLALIKRNGRVDNYEIDIITTKGRLRKVELTAFADLDSKGEVNFIQGILIDVTERIQFAVAREDALETERLLAEARWDTLRHQLNPHFLFNALNSLDALMINNHDSAREMIERLADFCRASLVETGDGMSFIANEIEMLKNYLWIERMRWQDSLQVEWKVDHSLNGLQIPVFTLQPLVENAIKYGQRSGSDPLIIKIRIEKIEKCVLIQVSNNGRWFDRHETGSESSGVGLKNLKERYRCVYGNNTKFETEEKDGFVFVSITCDFGNDSPLSDTPVNG